jgi:chromosome segregation ATPase
MKPTYDQLEADLQKAKTAFEDTKTVLEDTKTALEDTKNAFEDTKCDLAKTKELLKVALEEIAKLREQINRNSKNSSKAPSTDQKATTFQMTGRKDGRGDRAGHGLPIRPRELIDMSAVLERTAHTAVRVLYS